MLQTIQLDLFFAIFVVAVIVLDSKVMLSNFNSDCSSIFVRFNFVSLMRKLNNRKLNKVSRISSRLPKITLKAFLGKLHICEILDV